MGVLANVNLRLVTSIDAAMEMKRWAGERREGPLFIDTESGGLNPHRHRNRLIQLGDLHTGWAVPAEGWGAAATEIIRDYTGPLGMHNSPYDWRVLSTHWGLEPAWARTDDTLLAGHIKDSMRLGDLKARASQEIDPSAMAAERDLKAAMQAQGWTWDTVPVTWDPYWVYGAMDTVLGAHLWQRFSPEVLGSFRESYDLERATARICANMMTTGMMTDRPFILARQAELDAYLDQVLPWLQRTFRLANPGSAQQVVRAMEMMDIPVVLRTDKGNPSLDKDALAWYASVYPHAAEFFRAIGWCRKAGQVRSSLLGKFLELADSDGVIHCSIWSCRARTTRMSITDPAMQTFDRDLPMIRGSFIPRPGHVLISIDADQIEARLAAHVSGDPNMIRTFHEADQGKLNFFQISASRIYHEDVGKKDPRYTWTKNATYAQIYGSGLNKAAVTAGVPVDQMYPVYAGFQSMYPGLGRYMANLIRRGKSGRPQVRTVMGRRLYGQRGHEYALLNYQIQGSAAEIMKRGLVALDAAGFGPYLRLPIHDEFLIEAPEEYAPEMLRVASGILSDRRNFSVPITWAGKILDGRWVKT